MAVEHHIDAKHKNKGNQQPGHLFQYDIPFLILFMLRSPTPVFPPAVPAFGFTAQEGNDADSRQE